MSGCLLEGTLVRETMAVLSKAGKHRKALEQHSRLGDAPTLAVYWIGHKDAERMTLEERQ
jgi:hypothetical protein